MARTLPLGDAFGERRNALNALRLLLAASVVVWHAWLLTRPPADLAWPARQLLEELPVDAFFVISGFLITRSWLERRSTADFVAARALRILPGLWVCLAVTAFVVAPIAGEVALRDQWQYVAERAWILGAVPSVESFGAGSWNLSLWTLWWEVACYLAVVGLGLLGWLRLRVVLGVAIACWTFALLLAPVGDLPAVAWFDALPRLGMMFSCGSLLWMARTRIPFHGGLAAAALGLTAFAATLPDYRLLAAPAVAYLVIWTGVAAGRWSTLMVRYDVSYGVYIYGFPVQWALLATGTAPTFGGLLGLSMVLVLPVALASYLLVERPALRLRGRRPFRLAENRSAVEPIPSRT